MEEKEIVKPEVIKKKKNKKNENIITLAMIIAMLLGALGMYLLIYYVNPVETTSTIINKSEKEVTVTDKGIADAVEKLYDSVVVIEIYQNNQHIAGGTGFVYKTDGKKAYILTNNHVVESDYKNTVVKVKFTDGTEQEVKVEGTDEYADLAVLSLDTDQVLKVAEIGSSSDLRLGDTAFTIGSPLDTEFYWTVTRGIISGKDRMVKVSLKNSNTSDYVMRVIQTDTSINSGNSGGPLANSNGEVIGITNMKLVSSGVEGMGFAIPIEDAVQFAEAIINGEKQSRPLFGATMADLSNKSNLYLSGIYIKTELTEGVVIVNVQKGSPAEKAKIKSNDIIVQIDGEKVSDVATLRYILYKHSVGDTIEVTYERDGNIEKTKVKLDMANE